MTGIDAFMREARACETLGREEEAKLARKYRRGDKVAGQRIVRAHLRFAAKMAHRFASAAPLEDLVQEANLGLLRALESFDPKRGVRFISYASWWIRARLNSFCVRHTSVVVGSMTSTEASVWRKAPAIYKKLEASAPYLTRDERLDLVAHECGLTKARASRMVERGADVSLDAKRYPDSETTRVDCLPSPHDDPEDTAISGELRQIAHDAVEKACKSPRERYIAERRLLAHDPDTLAQIGERLGASRERVRQIEEGIKKRMVPIVAAAIA